MLSFFFHCLEQFYVVQLDDLASDVPILLSAIPRTLTGKTTANLSGAARWNSSSILGNAF
jgi:hypothetical protein